MDCHINLSTLMWSSGYIKLTRCSIHIINKQADFSTGAHTHHHTWNTWKDGGKILTNPNMPQCWRPRKGVATRQLGLSNQGRWNICCPIRASGTSGTNEHSHLTAKLWPYTLRRLFSPHVYLSSFFSPFILQPSQPTLTVTKSGLSQTCYSMCCCTPVPAHLHITVIVNIPQLSPSNRLFAGG